MLPKCAVVMGWGVLRKGLLLGFAPHNARIRKWGAIDTMVIVEECSQIIRNMIFGEHSWIKSSRVLRSPMRNIMLSWEHVCIIAYM
jgi:hypothetical protein